MTTVASATVSLPGGNGNGEILEMGAGRNKRQVRAGPTVRERYQDVLCRGLIEKENEIGEGNGELRQDVSQWTR